MVRTIIPKAIIMLHLLIKRPILKNIFFYPIHLFLKINLLLKFYPVWQHFFMYYHQHKGYFDLNFETPLQIVFLTSFLNEVRLLSPTYTHITFYPFGSHPLGSHPYLVFCIDVPSHKHQSAENRKEWFNSVVNHLSHLLLFRKTKKRKRLLTSLLILEKVQKI